MHQPVSPPLIQISGPTGQMERYIQAVQRAGGVPVPGYAPAPDPRCLGLVLCGGGDLEPALFGQENRGSHPPDSVRDQAELALVRSFLAWKRPILGICRGLQVLNVALGGTLIQDLPPERTALHQGGEDVFHPIRTAPGSLLAQCFGPELLVNSAHHQGVDLLGAQLNATAWAPDGTIEALEHTALPAVGVQFHPERLPELCGTRPGDRLFSWLIAQSQSTN